MFKGTPRNGEWGGVEIQTKARKNLDQLWAGEWLQEPPRVGGLAAGAVLPVSGGFWSDALRHQLRRGLIIRCWAGPVVLVLNIQFFFENLKQVSKSMSHKFKLRRGRRVRQHA